MTTETAELCHCWTVCPNGTKCVNDLVSMCKGLGRVGTKAEERDKAEAIAWGVWLKANYGDNQANWPHIDYTRDNMVWAFSCGWLYAKGLIIKQTEIEEELARGVKFGPSTFMGRLKVLFRKRSP